MSGHARHAAGTRSVLGGRDRLGFSKIYRKKIFPSVRFLAERDGEVRDDGTRTPHAEHGKPAPGSHRRRSNPAEQRGWAAAWPGRLSERHSSLQG